jgi:hypothetical protein
MVLLGWSGDRLLGGMVVDVTGREQTRRDADWSGAWAKPLRARLHHYFIDGRAAALCNAYQLRDVLPSQFVTGLSAYDEPGRCPTCERKLGYFIRNTP